MTTCGTRPGSGPPAAATVPGTTPAHSEPSADSETAAAGPAPVDSERPTWGEPPAGDDPPEGAGDEPAAGAIAGSHCSVWYSSSRQRPSPAMSVSSSRSQTLPRLRTAGAAGTAAGGGGGTGGSGGGPRGTSGSSETVFTDSGRSTIPGLADEETSGTMLNQSLSAVSRASVNRRQTRPQVRVHHGQSTTPVFANAAHNHQTSS